MNPNYSIIATIPTGSAKLDYLLELKRITENTNYLLKACPGHKIQRQFLESINLYKYIIMTMYKSNCIHCHDYIGAIYRPTLQCSLGSLVVAPGG